MASKLLKPGDPDRDRIAKRIDDLYVRSGNEGDAGLIPDVNPPRWRIDSRWVEFECGCRAERIRRLGVPAKRWDPIIFEGMPEQAVYDYVCPKHWPGMNKRCHFGGYVDFAQWRRDRRALLMGRTKG